VFGQDIPWTDLSTKTAIVAGAPVLDGILDDAVRSQAVVVDDFQQLRPVDYADLPEGKFDNRVVSANLAVTFTSTLSWVNLIQFDNVSNDLGIDSRFRWTPEPGRKFYVVLRHNVQRNAIEARFNATQTGLTVKLDHTFRF
jgi:hypothetical protein